MIPQAESMYDATPPMLHLPFLSIKTAETVCKIQMAVSVMRPPFSCSCGISAVELIGANHREVLDPIQEIEYNR